MLGGLGDMASMLKQAKQMQSKLKEVQDALANSRFEAQSGAGAVTATVTGKMELVGLRISPETVSSGDVEMLEDLIKSAVCTAQRKASEGAKDQMQKLTGGLSLPGLGGLLGGEE